MARRRAFGFVTRIRRCRRPPPIPASAARRPSILPVATPATPDAMPPSPAAPAAVKTGWAFIAVPALNAPDLAVSIAVDAIPAAAGRAFFPPIRESELPAAEIGGP